MFHFHKWKYVDEYEDTSFLGESLIDSWPKFRVCEKCDRVERVSCPPTAGFSPRWNEVRGKRKKIFLETIKSEEQMKEYFLIFREGK